MCCILVIMSLESNLKQFLALVFYYINVSEERSHPLPPPFKIEYLSLGFLGHFSLIRFRLQILSWITTDVVLCPSQGIMPRGPWGSASRYEKGTPRRHRKRTHALWAQGSGNKLLGFECWLCLITLGSFQHGCVSVSSSVKWEF